MPGPAITNTSPPANPLAAAVPVLGSIIPSAGSGNAEAIEKYIGPARFATVVSMSRPSRLSPGSGTPGPGGFGSTKAWPNTARSVVASMPLPSMTWVFPAGGVGGKGSAGGIAAVAAIGSMNGLLNTSADASSAPAAPSVNTAGGSPNPGIPTANSSTEKSINPTSIAAMGINGSTPNEYASISMNTAPNTRPTPPGPPKVTTPGHTPGANGPSVAVPIGGPGRGPVRISPSRIANPANGPGPNALTPIIMAGPW